MVALIAGMLMPVALANAFSVTNYTGYTSGGYRSGNFFRTSMPVNVIYPGNTVTGNTVLSETYNGATLTLSLTQGSTTRYDLGFYTDAGTLGSLAENGLIISGQNFEVNLWIDPQSWTWSNGNFINLGATDGAYGLGTTTGSATVNGISKFYITSASSNSPLSSQNGNTLSVSEIESDLGASGPSTPVAIWVGIGPFNSAANDIASVSSICTPISGATIDTLPVTAAIVAQSGETISNTINATGCGVGVYVGPGVTGVTINNAVISSATLAGVYVNGGSADVSGSTISNIGTGGVLADFNGDQYGFGLLYDQGATGSITNTVISSYQKAGIKVTGQGTNVKVAGDTVTGIGQTPLIAQNGVEIVDDATGEIINNTVSGNSYNGVTACPGENYFASNCYQSGGILLVNPATSMTIQNNEVFNNDIGIWAYSIGSTIAINTISDNTHNNYGYDIVYDGVDGLIANTLVSNSTVGILATPEAYNTIVTVNSATTRFGNVINDYQTAPNIPTNSFSASIMFSTPKLDMSVNANVINDEDSGLDGYWAMDNFTRVIDVWQTGASNYTINFTDFGTSSIPANVLSPGKGILEPFSGNAEMNGEQSWVVVGTFNSLASPTFPDNGFPTAPSTLTGNGSIGTYNAMGTTADLLKQTYAKQNGGLGSVSNSIAFVNSYFSNVISEEQPGFNYTYTYNSPLGVQKWIDTSNTKISPGDIVTNKLVLNVTEPIVNNPDSGYHGYWALDNFSRTIHVWQTGIHSFFMTLSDSGTANTFTGLPSPGQGVPEPNNGIASIVGSANVIFNGTFAPSPGNTVSTSNALLPVFNNHGSFTGNSIDITNSISTIGNFLGRYFDVTGGVSNFTMPFWSWTYTYNAPVKNEQWINANTGTSGDILTGFTINPYANAFLWFGYNTYSSNVPFGTWSNCPYSPGNTIVTVFCNTTALSNANWDVNTQSYLTSSTKTFTYNGTTLVEHFGSLNTPPPLISNTITFTNSGNGVWTANPANNRLITYNSVTSTPYGFILWGGNLTFSGMPSQANFTEGTLYEWSYIYTGNYLNNTATYPDAVYVPSENAYLALTSVVSLSANALTGPQIKSLVSNTPYLGPYPGTTAFLLTTYDNDFLWISANEYFAPAAPFGHWSATPAGCYNQPVPGTGICANANNGYANLGGSEDLNALTLSGNVLSTSIAETAQNNSITFMRNGNNWIMLPNKLSLTVNSLPVSEYWRGTLSFNGMPSQANFTSGLLAQWDYVNASSTNTIVTSAFPDAVYDQAMKAWLISFNVYNLENKCYPSGCPIPSSYFSMPFPNDFSQLSGTAEPLPYSTPVMLALNGTPVTLVTNATEHTFILSTYDNDFIWFGFSEFGTNAPYGIWSNCPNVSSSTNNACLGITATGSNAFGNSNWDLNAQSFGTGSDFTPFVVEGNTLVTQMAASPYQPMKMSGYLHFNRVGSTNTWTANPLQPNNMELTYPTTNNTSAAFGYILVGGNLTFNGMPSAANFTSGVIKEWAYNYNNTVGNTLGLGTFPDVITVPSQSNALLALTSLSYMSGAPLTVNAISNLIANAGYLGPAPGASAVLSGHTANVAVTIPSNTPVSVNYTSAGAVLSIKSTGSNTITAKVFIANLTANTSTTPSVASTAFTKLLVLNLSVNSTGAPSNSITYALTVAYPCGSNAAPYKLNITTGAWIALNYSKNTTGAPASCTMSFTIPPDPVIGVFTSTPVTTTTVPPASTAANPSGPAPTAAVPTVVPYTTSNQTGYELYNMTTDNSESMLINGTSFTLTQNFITPSSSGVTVNGNSYTLAPGGTAQIAGQSNVYVHLVSISYLPVLHTVNYTFYQAITPAPVTTTSVTTTVPTTVTTVAPTVAPTTTAAPTPPPSAAPPSSTDYLVIGAIIVIVAVLATLLYYSRRGGRAQRRASRPAR